MTTTPFEKGTLVVIDGLQSAEGKKLNGGLAIILNKPVNDAKGFPRYPIRIFALPKDNEDDDGKSMEILPDVMDKSMKLGNVQACPSPETNETFQEAAFQFMRQAGTTNNKSLLFWVELMHKIRGQQEINWTVSYANAIRELESKKQESSDLMYRVFQETPADVMQAHERYPSYLKEAVLSFCDAREHLELALEYALLIPTNTTPEAKANSKEALLELIQVADKILSEHCGLMDISDTMANIKLKVAMAMYERHSGDDPNQYLTYVAGGMCLTGNNFEGAKWYRRALDVGGTAIPDNQVRLVKDNCIIAQLMCPGMPLEHYHLINSDASKRVATCVLKSDKDKLRPEPGGAGVRCVSGTPDVQMYPIPEHPDDLRFLPLIQKLAWNHID